MLIEKGVSRCGFGYDRIPALATAVEIRGGSADREGAGYFLLSAIPGAAQTA